MRRAHLVFAACALVAVVVMFLCLFNRPTPAGTAAIVSPQERMTAQAARVADRTVRLSGGEALYADDSEVQSFRDELSGDEFWIDTRSAQVVSWSSSRPGVVTGQSVGQARAEEAAGAVVRRMTPGLGRSESREGRVQHHSNRRTDDVRDQYVVTFDEYIEGVRTQNGMSVVVNASDGRILSATARYTELRVSLSPRVSAEQAVKAAERAAHIPVHTDQYTELRVIETINTPQTLIWWVELATGDARFGGIRTVFIDAQSGQALELMTGGEQLRWDSGSR